MDCCINKQAWCFATDGLINVGQDEIVILLELIEGEKTVPKDIFFHINNIYSDAVKGLKKFSVHILFDQLICFVLRCYSERIRHLFA